MAAATPMRLCRDEACPSCGWPETYAEVDFDKPTPGADALGCSKCGWRVEAPPTCPMCDTGAQDPDGHRWATVDDSGTLCTECTRRLKALKLARSGGAG